METEPTFQEVTVSFDSKAPLERHLQRQDPRNDEALRPRFCVWETTLSCNLRCGHCGSRAGRPRPHELDTRQALEVVAQLAGLGCRLLTLSGGEPLMRPDWDQLAQEGVRRGITVNMVTNGLLVDERRAKELRDVGLSNVGVSLDGLPGTHEGLRGKGTFQRLQKAIAHLTAAGVPVTVMTTLDRFNEPELEAVHALAVDLGAAAWRVQLGKTMGTLADNDHRVIRPMDLLDVIPRLARIKKSSPIWVDVGDSIGYYGPHEGLLRKARWGNMQNLWRGCQAGLRTVGIESDGGVKGCLSLQGTLKGHKGDPFREGDLKEHSLEEIWFDPEVFAFNRRFRLDSLTGSCASCRYKALCRGGARCVSSAFTGALGEDPYCYHRVATLQAKELEKRGGRGSISKLATAAAMAMGLGLGGACLGGCLDRNVGTRGGDGGAEPLINDAGIQDAETDAEPDRKSTRLNSSHYS